MAFAFAFVIIIVFFSAVVFLFIVFLVGLLSKEQIRPRINFAGIQGLALMPAELLLKVRLRVGSPLEGIHRNFEFSAANAADSECRSGVKPFDHPNAALDHVSFFPNRNRAFRF
jgi:hypothetical protein